MIKWPKIGLGTYHLHGERGVHAIIDALDIGYRLIDTAQSYENEREVGTAIKKSKISRDEIIICTKIATNNLNPMSLYRSVQESLERLQTDYIDVLMIHWPKPPHYNPKVIIPALNEFQQHGLCNNIAVCNFTSDLLNEALTLSKSPIAANQVEMHPGFSNIRILEHNSRNSIKTIAHSPLGHREVLDYSILQKIAKEKNNSTAQIALAYVRQKEAVPIPKSSSKIRLKENFESCSIKLTNEEINKIDDIPQHRLINPPYMKWD